VHDWARFGVWEERREELVREAESRRLARELRAARKASAEERSGDSHVEARDGGIEIRWGLLEDEPGIASLLELNGMPRWIAREERYIVAERDGEILAAMGYQTQSKRLLLGLLVSDPRAEERPLAVALYARAGALAREMGVREVWARIRPRMGYLGAGELAREFGVGENCAEIDRRVEYLREAGYRRGIGGWRRSFALWSTVSIPFFRASL
jgi:hypothetical protein